jgi:hypothetical protein
MLIGLGDEMNPSMTAMAAFMAATAAKAKAAAYAASPTGRLEIARVAQERARVERDTQYRIDHPGSFIVNDKGVLKDFKTGKVIDLAPPVGAFAAPDAGLSTNVKLGIGAALAAGIYLFVRSRGPAGT